MPPHKTLTIESISGTSYEFGVYPLDENPEFPALPGIYIFTKRYLRIKNSLNILKRIVVNSPHLQSN